MKNFTRLALVGIMIASICFPSHAINATTASSVSASIVEVTKDDGTVMRILKRDATPDLCDVHTTYSGSNNILKNQETKAELEALGVGMSAIENLSDEELDHYANAQLIVTTQQYSKRDEFGNITYLTKEQALAEVNAINARGIEITEENQFTDEYMNVTVTASTVSGARTKITVDATWLTDPNYRGKDTLAAGAKYLTVLDSTRSGYLEYTIENRAQTGEVIESLGTHRELFSPSDCDIVYSEPFYGAGIHFDLPNNTYAPSYGVYETAYTDFHAHFTYEGNVEIASDELYFNVVGTYTHTVLGITFNPDLTITVDGPDFSIAPSVTVNKESRTAKIEVHYLPN